VAAFGEETAGTTNAERDKGTTRSRPDELLAGIAHAIHKKTR
jgi:hypothetical protein